MRNLSPPAVLALALAATACASAPADGPRAFDAPGREGGAAAADSASAAPSAGGAIPSAQELPAAVPIAPPAPSPSPAAAFARRGPQARLLAPPPAPQRFPGDEDLEPEPQGNWRRELFPDDGLLYDAYLAAPRQSRTAVKVIFPTGGDDNHKKIENTIGFHLPVLRWNSIADPSCATELEFEAAVFARFDRKERWDMDATDWRFGIPLVHRDGDLAWKIHLYHLTSHLGDEYMVRTGAEPVDYHLEEAAFGVSYDATEGQRLYGEAAVAVYASRATDNGRFQAGWEWVGRKATTGLSPYMAIDLASRHDHDWKPGKTAAVGVAYGRHVRMNVEYYHGYDPQTQFGKTQVQYVALGLAMDF